METPAPASRPQRLLLICGILAIGLLLRAIFLAQARGTPLWDLLFLDALSYHNWARAIAGGDWVGGAAFHMPPLYPYLLAVVYSVFGAGDAPKLLQLGLGVLNGLLLFLLAERVAGRTAAIVAFLLSLLYGPFLFYEIQILNTTIAITLALAMLLLLDGALERAGRSTALLAGVALGAGALIRPEFLLFAPLAAAAILLLPRPIVFGGARRLTLAILFALGAAGPLGLCGVRNLLVSGDFVLITHHGGISFYMGNNELSDGTYRPPPFFQGTPEAIDQRDSRRFAEMEAGRPLQMSEVESYWYAKAFDYIRRNPGAYAALLAKKLALYLGSYEIPLNASWDFFRRYSSVLLGASLSFGLIVPLALFGGLGLRSRRAVAPALFVLANMAAVTAFFVCDRYRQPAAPLLIIFAGAGLTRAAGLARERRYAALALALFVIVGAAALLNIRLAGNPSLSFARSHVAVGQAALRRGDRAQAEVSFRSAIRENPYYIDALMNLGTLYQTEGRLEEAIDAYNELLGTNPEFAGAYLNRGACAQARGRLEEALSDYRRAEELDPFLPSAPNNAGFVLQQAGRWEEAEAAYRRAIAKDATFVGARVNLGSLLESRGRLEEAAAEYGAALPLLTAEQRPTAAAIEARLGDLLVARARYADAEAHYRRALGIVPPTAERLSKLADTLVRLQRRDEARRALGDAIALGGEPVRRAATADSLLAPLLDR